MLNARGGVHDSLINPLARRAVPRGYFTVVRRNSVFGPGPIRNYALLRQRFRCRADDRTRKFTVAGNFTWTTCVKNKPPSREDAS